MRRRSLLLLAALPALMGAAPGGVYPRPGKPVRLVVPYPAGGGADALARHLARAMGERLQTQVVVDNRPGATSVIGAMEVARAQPDGHTLLLNTTGFIVVLPFQKSKLPYDPWTSFTPITPLMDTGLVLMAHPAVPAHDVHGLVAYAKERPGELSYASWGIGGASHFFFAMLERQAGIKLHHVPYKGLPEIHPDLVANRIQLVFDATQQGQEYVRRGKLRALAVTGASRLPGLAEVPTLLEQGFPGFERSVGMGLFGPGGLSATIAERLQQEIEAIVASDDTRRFMSGFGFQGRTLRPQSYLDELRSDAAYWGPVLQQLGIRLD